MVLSRRVDTGADCFDPRDPGLVHDPYPVFAELRAAGRPLWSEQLGMWLAARYRDADAVVRHRALGRIHPPRQPEDLWALFNQLERDSVLGCEPPKHTRLRGLLGKAFVRSNIERLRPHIEELCGGLLDGLEERTRDGEPFDLIVDYAEPLPVMIIAELLGIPDGDRHLLRPWSAAMMKMNEYGRTPAAEAAARAAAAEFDAFVRKLAARRRHAPQDDLITHLVQAEQDGDQLSEDELVATVVVLLNAGHEASVNCLGNGMVVLLNHPGQQRRLAGNPVGLAATATEEFLRFDSPLHLFERTAMADVEIGGVVVRAGERIAALLGSANRDGEVFERADEFDIGRDPNPHIAFGGGVHFCVGAPLARVEVAIAVRCLIERFPRLRPAGTPVRRPAFVQRGWTRVPVAV
ncbi:MULTISPECIES: cytochrome P450 [Protofrankia]|uniref:Linalool 8-monooxygenase n=1 Tax=Candidatus Protofrankia datiscae TaxID=2716812 RepID=F8B632_9ACTN|nr:MULTISPECIES: cytochrome P450 [Protofrankia]AEH10186.1 Linalool 8-monooxygenase [Candidatus Protofrankia datiscae]